MALPKRVWKISRFHKGISNFTKDGFFWFAQCLEFDFFAPFMTVANKFFKEVDNPVNYATIQFLIGEALYRQGNIKGSLGYYSEAERVAEKFNPDLARQITSVKKVIQSLQ